MTSARASAIAQLRLVRLSSVLLFLDTEVKQGSISIHFQRLDASQQRDAGAGCLRRAVGLIGEAARTNFSITCAVSKAQVGERRIACSTIL
ncbi:MAG: hypothetical protein D6690_05845 [Nitrospirae bacterium]|nr:MAG: hypothetical protein D6690_05845 [Nitrospirota bacterium]